MADTSFDVIVIGGGPGGYVAAIRAAQLGLKTAVVEREHLGGICLNWGCIPTKALLRSAEIFATSSTPKLTACRRKASSFDLAKIVARSRGVSPAASHGVSILMKKNKITVFDGQGKLAGKGKVAVTKDGKPVADLAAKNIILATGARARTLPGLEPDGKLVWTYNEAMVPDVLPKRLLVVGSGAIGIEFASFYQRPGRRGDRGRSAGPRPAGGRRGNLRLRPQGLREAGHEDHHRRHGHEAEQGRPTSVTVTIEAGGKTEAITVDRVISGRRHRRQCREYRPGRHQGQGREDPCGGRPMAARPASPASMPSATSPARPGWRTRPA